MQTVTNESCPTETYNGLICLPYLRIWRSCVLDKTESTIELAMSNSPQSEREKLLNDLNGILSKLLVAVDIFIKIGYYVDSFPDCKSEALPFFCQYSFPLMDCESGQVYQSSKQECLRISTSVCPLLWSLGAMDPNYADALPVCEDLQEGIYYS